MAVTLVFKNNVCIMLQSVQIIELVGTSMMDDTCDYAIKCFGNDFVTHKDVIAIFLTK